MNNKSSNKIEYIMLVIMSVATCVFMFSLEYHTPISFDGGMNFTISRSLNNIGKYATDYQSVELFAARIQTGATVIFPTALLNVFFGITSNNMQIVTTMYGCLLTIAFYYLLSKRTNYAMACFSTIFLLGVSSYTSVSYIGIGETSMGLFIFMVCALIVYGEEHDSKKYFAAAGVCFGLGYLTKTIFLIIVPAIGLLFLIRLISKKGRLSNYLFFVLFALIPIFAFEIYKMLQLGFQDYIEWWKYMIRDILGQAGVTQQHTASQKHDIAEFVLHVRAYCDLYDICPIVLCGAYVVPAVAGCLQYRKEKRVDMLMVLFYGIALTYMFWWVVMSPSTKLWPRRILMGYVCLLFVVSWSIWKLVILIFEKKRIRNIIMLFYFVALMIPMYNNYQESFNINKSYKQLYSAYADGINYLKELPQESVFYGVDWWENPTVSGMGNIPMADLVYGIDNYEYAFYVEEEIERRSYGTQGTRNMVMAQYDIEPVFENSAIRVFKINGRKNLEDMESYINLSLSEDSVNTFKFYYSNFEQAHGEINKSVFIADKEKTICVEIFSSDVDKILLGITSNKPDTVVKVKGLTVKLGEEIIDLDAKGVYELVKDSPGTSSFKLDPSGDLIIKFDNDTQIFFNIH